MHDDPLGAAPGPRPDPARRARILGHLERLGPGPKATYETLCGLLDAPEPLPAASMLLHHMVRELESALREVMREARAAAGASEPDAGGEPRRREVLAMVAGLELAPDAGGEPRREEILAMIRDLELVAGKERHRAEIVAITAGLGVEPEVVKAWSAVVGKQQGWAHRRNLDAPEAVGIEVRERIDRLERVFDTVLDAHAARYGQFVHERLTELLAIESPTRTDAQLLRTQFPQDALTQQVFFNAAGRGWLNALHSAKVFRNPPGPLDAGDGYVSFPWWPASAYLVRMAEQAQLGLDLDAEQARARAADQVTIVQIVQSIPASDNPRVGMDIARIARLLEPAHAARLADRLAEALAGPHVIGADDYAAAAAALAAGGQGAAAARVLRALLVLGGSEAGVRSIRIGDWEYGEVLRRHLPAVADALGIETLELLASILTEAVGETDAALVWLRTVAGAESSETLFDPWVGLVAAIRDVAVRLAGDGVPAGQILARLPLKPAGLLARIHLHLLGLEEFAAAVPEQVRAAITDPDLLHARATEPEFLRLVEARAELLTAAERAALQKALEAGPDTAAWQRTARASGAMLRPDALALLETRWRLERYSAVAAILDEAGCKALDAMVATYGTAPFQRPRTGWQTDPSVPPAAASALSGATTAHELAAALAAHRSAATAGEDPASAISTAFALAGQVRTVVAANAAAFSAEAGTLAKIDENLTAYALGGFGDALRGGAVLDWTGLEPLGAAAAAARGAARCEAVRLIQAAAQRDALPVGAADWAWRILAGALAPDEDTDPASDAAHRAEAVHAVAEFARWGHRAGNENADAAAAALAGIDPRSEPDPVAQAVGAETWNLLELGHPAAAERLAALTPGTAGFTGYLDTFDPTTERQMLGAFDRALTVELPEADHRRIGFRLLRLYVGGVIGLQPAGLAERWWRHPRTSAEAIRDLAVNLAQARLQAGDAGDAFNTYVDWRLAALDSAPGTTLQGPARLELMTLAPTCLRTAPTAQAIARLGRILAAIGDLTAEPETWQRLLEASRTEPTAVLGLLHEWSKRLKPTSLAPGRRDEEITAIWRAALDSGDPAQVELATRAINRAAAAGFHTYLSLLPTAPSEVSAQE